MYGIQIMREEVTYSKLEQEWIVESNVKHEDGAWIETGKKL